MLKINKQIEIIITGEDIETLSKLCEIVNQLKQEKVTIQTRLMGLTTAQGGIETAIEMKIGDCFQMNMRQYKKMQEFIKEISMSGTIYPFKLE